jgi:spore germination cell wall hydrolase CwlJ-like protein
MTPLAKLVSVLAIFGAGLDINDPPTFATPERDFGRTCLALVGFSEARDQGDAGLAAVMRVVINRTVDPAHRWPRTLCEVVLQPGQFVGVDSWPVPRHPERIDATAWQHAQDIAELVLAGKAVPAECANATGFDQDPPRENRGVVCRLGVHTFYAEPLQAQKSQIAAN